MGEYSERELIAEDRRENIWRGRRVCIPVSSRRPGPGDMRLK